MLGSPQFPCCQHQHADYQNQFHDTQLHSQPHGFAERHAGHTHAWDEYRIRMRCKVLRLPFSQGMQVTSGTCAHPEVFHPDAERDDKHQRTAVRRPLFQEIKYYQDHHRACHHRLPIPYYIGTVQQRHANGTT